MHPDQLAEKLCVGGVAMIREMLPFVYDVKRETISASVLSLALQCGGSYSWITANPLLGAVADILVSYSSTAILSETPKIYGAEHLLIRRAVSVEAGEKLVERIRWRERVHQAKWRRNAQ
jgi:altronate hydrolase